MGTDQKTGSDTIADIRARGFGRLCIVGSSANDLEEEHIAAGAQLFWRKPIPNQNILVSQTRE